MHACERCGSWIRDDRCPFCAGAGTGRTAALLLGLALTGCGKLGKDETAQAQPAYGEAMVDEDGDGWDEGSDCDDADPAVNPDAKETPGDGVDANCDGEDDT